MLLYSLPSVLLAVCLAFDLEVSIFEDHVAVTAAEAVLVMLLVGFIL
jgi:hypothetical protein